MMKDEAIPYEESFRDHLYNTDDSGKRIKFFPKKPSGRLYNKRSVVSYILLAILFTLPWIQVNGRPFFLLNFLERKFIIFGTTFWPQDFHLVVILALVLIISIVLFTMAFGRLWCGWACPQTIFLEMVFRKIEYWIEGDSASQKRLANAPMNASKFFKRFLKHSIFVSFSFAISNTFLAYIFGRDRLFELVTSSPFDHLLLFFAVLAFTGAFYFVFAWFREQACTMVCPYGRLQGVLLDNNSMVISYDHVRGEPRNRIKKGEDQNGHGDCIDCKLCVAVCPTGIDIRNGTQLECVNCTACIDACDDIMDKVRRPRGLIRFASANTIEQSIPFHFTSRMKAYTGILTILMLFLVSLLVFRSETDTSLLRSPGMTYKETEGGYIANLYNFKVVNKTAESKDLEWKLVSPENGKFNVVGTDMHAEPNGMINGSLMLEIPENEVTGYKTEIVFELYEDGKRIEKVTSTFLGPMKFN